METLKQWHPKSQKIQKVHKDAFIIHIHTAQWSKNYIRINCTKPANGGFWQWTHQPNEQSTNRKLRCRLTYQDNECGLFIPLGMQETSTLGRKTVCECLCVFEDDCLWQYELGKTCYSIKDKKVSKMFTAAPKGPLMYC